MAAFQTGGYPVPPPGFSPYDYRPQHSQTSPYSGNPYSSGRQFSSHATPPRGHSRRQTEFYAAYPSYTTPPRTYPSASPGFSFSPSSAQPPRSARKPDYVSDSHRTRSYRVRTETHGGFERSHPGDDHYKPNARHGDHGRSDEDLPRYEKYEPRPPPYARFQTYQEQEHPADHRYYGQERIYTPAEEPRPRRASYTGQNSARPSFSRPQARPRTATKDPKEQTKKREATPEDAIRQQIPAGFSLKNWDPEEEPILLMGSVFDANSLGKWIFDWVAYVFKPRSPFGEMAGDFWCLLIKLAASLKVIEDYIPRVRDAIDHDILEEFQDAGERIWERFSKLLLKCEEHMWKKHKAKHGRGKKVPMDKDSGVAFVEAMWGIDYYLTETEKIAQSIRLFSMRFDANCKPIILPGRKV